MPDALVAALAGLGTGLSLIVAIGAQNAFVLRQGIRREHVAAVVAICAVSDAALITVGISGIGTVVKRWPAAVTATAWIGAAFLICYGLLAARRALHPATLDGGGDGSGGSLRTAVLTCLAMTWLNPHVYLDTVLLLGSVATGYGGARWSFGLGAAGGSVLWFGALGFGARLLRGAFARPASWRVLDAVIACTMITLGVVMATRT
ncbi:L-lysine exporter family protein LysE/ArgO [Streptomyces sp. DvalAA-14]|uniref:LysE/ArgO family amino acid transporter n=1 Tax=unclassified Streptomyces TaxID=2593676 RepID=UPI00081B2F68|nr:MULTISPECIES: LysE/ArgO family amino acid transporter [unclassified Streptomyces]MYS23944.1 LysE family transporter [Streptomyces sp. SID4948]SCE40835.1 L-lysine exporter family protein LysE/ArgO [Streptomyces sp. DvalAA-14]